MEKKHCKWYNEEFCTNDKSPCVADYCPVVEYPELCKFREVAEDINAPNKDEKTLEFDDDVVDLLVEFDEMGFAPTTTCPNPEEYAREWKMAMLKKVHRLQSENAEWQKDYIALDLEARKLQTELDKELAEHEEFAKKAKAEIARTNVALLEAKNNMLKYGTACVKKGYEKAQEQIEQLTKENANVISMNDALYREKKELQKQVDELKDPLYEEHLVNLGYAKAVKDTAEKFAEKIIKRLINITDIRQIVDEIAKEITEGEV